MDFIFIAGINRSGGSLLARLFDGHKDFASYPMEVGFKFDNTSYGFSDKITGTPTYIPDFDEKINPFEYFDVEKEIVSYSWGKETSAKFGIRKNYIEKAFYEKSVKTDFNYENYLDKLGKYCNASKSNQELYEGKHKAYFESWDDGAYFNDPKFIVTHDSNGLFLSDFKKYFNEFKNSFILVPIRDCIGYVAAEKTRIARKAIGSRRFSKPLPPNWMIKKFQNYSIDGLVRSWMVSITKIRILQENFGLDKNLMVYRFENLVNDTEKHIKYICEKNCIKFDNIFLKPTLMGKPWLGNSQQGINDGINKNPNNYVNQVLTNSEIQQIEMLSNNFDTILNKKKNLLIDLMDIKKDQFFDYNLQKKYSKDNDQWAIYCALGFKGFRDSSVKAPYLYQTLYFFFSIFVRIYHFPRFLKQRFFPNKGKQNYT